MGGFRLPLNISMTELQQDALKKYNKICMGTTHSAKLTRLYAIQSLINKTELSPDDVAQLEFFLTATNEELDLTSFFANTVVYPNCWGRETHRLTVKKA